MPSADRIAPIRGADHAAVLDAALEARAGGRVPLVGDERWTQGHWDAVVRTVRSHGVPQEADWATFTSGSAGTPRVVLRTEASWRTAYPAVTALLDARAGDRILVPVHPVSSMALNAAAHARATGLDVRVPAGARLRATDLAGPDGPELMHGTPWQLRDLVDLLEAGTRTTLRGVLVGGDRLDPALAARARAQGLRVASYFGAAELSYVAADTGDGLRPLDGVDVQVRDGVLWVRTPQRALGTVGAGGHLTAGALQDDDGWVTVGDRARLEDGVLVPAGRADEAILTAGATVVPADVEAVLTGIEGVQAALVVGRPDALLGQRVAAYLEPAPGTVLDAAAVRRIRSAAGERLAVAQRPRHWRTVPELPRTGSGKVRRLDAGQAEALAGETLVVRPDASPVGDRA
ncbi:AMP-binding protein [Citricoccus nitrophenolicus]|uniref:AMP-binding protein n=1 Tax=Citricoccus nitrophenolicus TaxID=863575 RepID=A0ABV0IJ83_9MICC